MISIITWAFAAFLVAPGVFGFEGTYLNEDPLSPAVFLSESEDYNDPNGHLNPFSVDNTLMVFCGVPDNQTMKITFRGDARKVFAAKKEGCVAKETEPGHFQIMNAQMAPCEAVQNGNLQVFSLEMIVQKGLVRQHDDPTYIITCNYEKGGEQSSATKKTDDRDIVREALFGQANNETTTANMTMVIRDANGDEITTAYTGSYIQIVMTMDVVSASEESFRPWNCKASSTDENSREFVHWFVLGGCGDGDVIRRDRGFFSRSIDADQTQAKSVFFRAFSLTNVASISFECNYIIKGDSSLNGATCAKSPNFVQSRRKRRAIGEESTDEDVNVVEPLVMNSMMSLESLPMISSQLLLIAAPHPALFDTARNVPGWNNQIPNMPRRVHPHQAEGMWNTLNDEVETMSQETKLGLIIGISLAAAFLLAVSSVAIYLSCRLMHTKSSIPQYSQCYTKESGPIVKSPPPVYQHHA